jgi:hypothetical protein
MNLRFLMLIIVLATFFSCDFKKGPLSGFVNKPTVWVFAWFNVNENSEDNYWYYFGEIDSLLYTQIANNLRKNGILTLRNIRYWNEEGKLQMFEDIYSRGVISFKITSIEKMELLKNDPLLLYSEEEIDPETYKTFNKIHEKTIIEQIGK